MIKNVIDGIADKIYNRNVDEIPFSERVLLLPKCIRAKGCIAEEKENGLLECKQCRKQREDGSECPVPMMTKTAEEIGYKKTYLMMGGSRIPAVLEKDGKPKMVIAVACADELEMGEKKMRKLGIKSQVIHLTKDGCTETTCFKGNENREQEWKEMLTGKK